MTAGQIFLWIVISIAALGLFLWWHGHYVQSCIGDGHTPAWCNSQFWQTL